MVKRRSFQHSAVAPSKFPIKSEHSPKPKQFFRSRPLQQDGKKSQRVLLQIEVPDYPELGEEEPNSSLPFKGLETDFPCLTRVQNAGPEPEYDKITMGFKVYNHETPFMLKYNGGILPHLKVAFETWGELNEEKNNAVLISAGLSASSHAKSHQENVRPGWWEKFVGPGCAVDTNKFFVICTNNLGGCYALSLQPYGTTFPIVSVEDMVNAQMLLMDHLGIQKCVTGLEEVFLIGHTLFADEENQVIVYAEKEGVSSQDFIEVYSPEILHHTTQLFITSLRCDFNAEAVSTELQPGLFMQQFTEQMMQLMEQRFTQEKAAATTSTTALHEGPEVCTLHPNKVHLHEGASLHEGSSTRRSSTALSRDVANLNTMMYLHAGADTVEADQPTHLHLQTWIFRNLRAGTPLHEDRGLHQDSHSPACRSSGRSPRRLISKSSCAQSHPSAIAFRYLQRKCIMSDHNWNKGHYYDGDFPKIGMKLAREIATLTYRSGPEWDQRFGRGRINDRDPPSLCPTFHIESYLEHQGESFSNKFDPNSLLYMSKAMDLFDVSEGFDSLEVGLSQVTCPAMVIGVQTDILFPIWEQRKLAQVLQAAGNDVVTFYELNSMYGHDTFLLDLNGVGTAVKGFLETDMSERGILAKEAVKRKVSMKTNVKLDS
ncbi:LOW QUALITY PROTEIN: uncharacterized protein LOC124257240 [Haliotis rubra]|uniref:LOW QUALITY PROTEIN: uncharacterized protein LOC124257240 n=1 Tax=Haliotis rubra TaxID=36100 RepID=UPI001EE54CE2|nr:LOW QUALITY PROTEIN: uncharacterized protein LOC124257240 [Haliotis rubra]